jgi:hypothetical protein
MQSIRSSFELKDAIRILKAEQSVKLELLKEQFSATVQSLSPINLLRNTLNKVTSAPSFKTGLTATLVGFAAVFFTGRMFKGPSTCAFRKVLWTLLETGLTGFIAQHSDAIRSFGGSLFKYLLLRKEPKSNES